MPTETFGEWADRVFPGLVPPARVFNDTEALRDEKPLTEEDEKRYLVVAMPPVERPRRDGHQTLEYRLPTPPLVRWIDAFSEEEAIDKAGVEAGRDTYVIEASNVAKFRIPSNPAPVRA